MSKDQELTPAETARKLGITLDAVYRLVYAGKLPARKTGNRWVLPLAAVSARLKAKEARDGAIGTGK
jgi:excisionase family DNA binding protein